MMNKEGLLAAQKTLCELIRERDILRDGWEPDKHEHKTYPHIKIWYTDHDCIDIRSLSFKTKDQCIGFEKAFGHLIENIIPLFMS